MTNNEIWRSVENVLNGGSLMNKWIVRGLKLAEEASTWSKDRSKIGACLMRPDHKIASYGYNGLPPGLDDEEILKDRELKNKIIIHAEENAILNCSDPSLENYSLFVYGLNPCNHCASVIASKGIKYVYAVATVDSPQWYKTLDITIMVFGNKAKNIQ